MAETDRSSRGGLAFVCKHDGTVITVLRDDLGLAAAGAPLSDLVDPASSQKADRFIAAILRDKSAFGWQLNVTFGPRAVTFNFAGAATGETLLIVGASAPADLRDSELYDELSRLNNELINRERELARKTAALERAAAERSRLIAIAAHDLRNPLTIVASYADLLRLGSELSDEELLYVDEISRSAKFMGELVEELLDGARVESGIIDMELQDIDLVEAARHAAAINRMRADRKQIEMAFEHDVERIPIRADSVKLRQIINNLVVNAIKFSPIRTRVTIRALGAGERPSLEIEDQGIGIAPDDLQTIFNPFATIGRAGTAGEKSIGLGLAIVKQLVDLHHGRVSVTSESGRGSVFRVEFPRSA